MTDVTSRYSISCSVAAIVAACLPLAGVALPAGAQTYKVLYTAPGNPGLSNMQAQYNAQGRDGSIYTTSEFVGSDGGVFKISPDGTVTVTNSTIGGYIVSGVTLAQSGNFYGSNQNRGIDNCSNFNGCGQIFTITPAGAEKAIYSFMNAADGADPMAAPIQANDGLLYGTTPYSNNGDSSKSTAYALSYTGGFTLLHTFNEATEGSGIVAGLAAGTDGNFYGVAQNGGAGGNGTVFRMTHNGAVAVLHSFASSGSDGEHPVRPLTLAGNGVFYGVTPGGGSFNGTVFSITPFGGFKVLHTFTAATDGGQPNTSLTEGTDGLLYGTTTTGGKLGGGTIFSISVNGTFAVRHEFDSGAGAAAGWNPQAPLTQNTNGLFYSTTYQSGTSSCTYCGVVYSFDMALKPFVRTTTRTGAEGAVIGILGQGFTTATTVKFGGVSALKLVRGGANFIEATVPPAALSGSVTVATGAVTLTSNLAFLVTPTLASFSPTTGPAGSSVMLTGTGLAQTASVRFGSKSAAFRVVSDTKVSATVPAGAASAPIVVFTKGGRVQSASVFSVN